MPLHLIVKKPNSNLLILTLGMGFRFFFLGIILLFLFGMYTTGTGFSDLSPIPILFLLLSLLSLLYKESWVFDLQQGKIINKTGLLFFYRKKEFPLSQIQEFCLSCFTKGSLKETTPEKRRFFQKQYCALSFITLEENRKDLEIQNLIHKKRLEEKGKTISSFCSKPFTNRIPESEA